MCIETRELSYSYEPRTTDQRVLQEVSISIERGSWTAIIGPTGSGKSTLVQHFNGLLKPTSGVIFIDGVNINSRKVSSLDLKQKVGLVFQYPEHQLFERSVFDEVAYGPRNLGLPAAEVESSVIRALAMTGLDFETFKDRVPLELSGGEKRKVAIAGVLAMNPKIVVFDEPTAGLDPGARRSLLREVRALNKDSGLTIVWVTHNLSEVLEYADRVIVFSEGRVAAEGPPLEVFSNVTLLEGINLGVPQLLELEHSLKIRGIVTEQSFGSLEQAAKAITKILRGRNR